MREIAPGIWHWTALHEGIGLDVSSYYVEPAQALIDPMVPAEGLEWFADRRISRILLTNRHHYRHCDRFVEALGATVHCSLPGLHEFEGSGRNVEAFAFGDEVAPGITALEVGAICPDESALHIRLGSGALACADGVVRFGESGLGFVPDQFMGEDAETVKRGLRDAYARMLELEFDALLLAHGDPLVGGGKAALRDFARPSAG
jgi:hypothetical protein